MFQCLAIYLEFVTTKALANIQIQWYGEVEAVCPTKASLTGTKLGGSLTINDCKITVYSKMVILNN